MQKWPKYLKVKSWKSKIASQWAIRMQKRVIYSESLDKTESSKKSNQHDTLGENVRGYGWWSDT